MSIHAHGSTRARHAHTHNHASLYTHLFIRTLVHVYKYVYMFTFILARTYTRCRIFIYTHIHVQFAHSQISNFFGNKKSEFKRTLEWMVVSMSKWEEQVRTTYHPASAYCCTSRLSFLYNHMQALSGELAPNGAVITVVSDREPIA
jgi:hypothetical protein